MRTAFLVLCVISCTPQHEDTGNTLGESTSIEPTSISVSEGGSLPTSESSVSGTTSDPTLGNTSAGSSESSTSDDSGSTTSDFEPLPFPPTGCGHFVEALGRHAADFRHVTIDTSTCRPRAAVVLEFAATAPDVSEPFSVGLFNEDGGCRLIGGAAGPAGFEAGALVTTLEAPENLTAWIAVLRVDGELSDVVRAPGMLAGQDWFGFPDAPAFPMRRREDWSWVPAPSMAHVPGCELLPIP